MKENHNVKYRHIEYEEGGEKIAGIVLWYDDRESANAAFDVRRRHYDSSNQRISTLISFNRQDEKSYTFTFSFTTFDESFNATIIDVPSEYVHALIEYMKDYMYVFLLTGYTDINGDDKVVQDAVYSTSMIFVDGVQVNGSNNKKYPLKLLEKVRKELA